MRRCLIRSYLLRPGKGAHELLQQRSHELKTTCQIRRMQTLGILFVIFFLVLGQPLSACIQLTQFIPNLIRCIVAINSLILPVLLAVDTIHSEFHSMYCSNQLAYPVLLAAWSMQKV